MFGKPLRLSRPLSASRSFAVIKPLSLPRPRRKDGEQATKTLIRVSDRVSLLSIEASLDSFVNVGVERGAFATIFQLGYLITVCHLSSLHPPETNRIVKFLVAPDRRYWIPFQLISRRRKIHLMFLYLLPLSNRLTLLVFVVSYITMLNSRHVVRGEGVYDATSSVGNSSTAAAGPTRSGTRSRSEVMVSTAERYALSSDIVKAASANGATNPEANKVVPMVSGFFSPLNICLIILPQVTFETSSQSEQTEIWDISRVSDSIPMNQTRLILISS